MILFESVSKLYNNFILLTKSKISKLQTSKKLTKNVKLRLSIVEDALHKAFHRFGKALLG